MDLKIRVNQTKLNEPVTGKEFEYKMNQIFHDRFVGIDEILKFCSDYDCSDLYVEVGNNYYITRFGNIYQVNSYQLSREDWKTWSRIAISSVFNTQYIRNKMLDFSYQLPEKKYRYRASAGYTNGNESCTFRMIKETLPRLSSLNLPESVHNSLLEISRYKTGITLLCGPTGSGKSTTMVGLLNELSDPGNTLDNSVIISLEDPIEYILKNKAHVKVMQKELGIDFKDFATGIKQALREHPTYINIGETRDSETIKALIEASRTGHGVYSSFHASDVGDTISRIYDTLYNGNPGIMYDLIANMNMILCQKIKSNGDKFILNTQYMIFNRQIKDFLNNELHKGRDIPTVINKLLSNKELNSKVNIFKDWD